jgi:hypothetical protein
MSTEARTILNIEKLTREADLLAEGSAIIMGRQSGERVRDRIKLGQISANGLVLEAPADKTVTPSFFVGLLSSALGNFKTADEVRGVIDLRDATPTTRENFDSAIDTLMISSPVPRRNLLERLFA